MRLAEIAGTLFISCRGGGEPFEILMGVTTRSGIWARGTQVTRVPIFPLFHKSGIHKSFIALNSVLAAVYPTIYSCACSRSTTKSTTIRTVKGHTCAHLL